MTAHGAPLGLVLEGGYNVPGQAMWDKYFGSRNAVNLGFGWDGTQHVIWRLAKGESSTG